jgi:HAD superfamily hydrolase (TIGR01509 family)
VIFDLDGVLLDSERVWETARREVALANGGSWREDAQATMMGMSTTEWTAWMREELGVELQPQELFDEVTRRLEASYRSRLPLLAGAEAAVRGLAERWPLAIASSSSRVLIDLFLELSRLGPCFRASVSSEEVARGKPAPDVYLEAARRLGAQPPACVAIEDSTNGIRAAAAAGMVVIAIPEPVFAPAADAVALAAATLGSLEELAPEAVEGAASP